jgi:hypothetical protein
MTVDLRGAAYAASRISSTLKGSTKQFGWLQAPATMNATAEMQWRSPRYIHRHAVARGRSRVSQAG